MKAADRSDPPCYAMVVPGLESVAADEITRDLGGTVRKIDRGIVIFRVPHIGPELLRLRTVEDVFLLAWGTDALTRRAADLESIRKWTARDADWANLLRIHHSIRPKPAGKTSWHAVTQMQGERGYRRTDARDKLLEGLTGHIPAGWPIVDDNAAVEVWLTLQDSMAVCGVRLSDSSMRHRTYKQEHRPASLRPTVAAAMARLAGAGPDAVILDPCCGMGTILAEAIALARSRGFTVTAIGGDTEWGAVSGAGVNLRRGVGLARWDARELPLATECVDRILANPPFGKQLSTPEEVPGLYRDMVREWDRVLRPDGRAVVLVAEHDALTRPALARGWVGVRQLRVRVLGQLATLSVWRKPPRSA
ncbi:MAG: RNA methyltransferase [Gemmataceae bacterium]|nr:RNA methyltransferase [Gemmataceae bacterium]